LIGSILAINMDILFYIGFWCLQGSSKQKWLGQMDLRSLGWQ
jgi:hypothetical protein